MPFAEDVYFAISNTTGGGGTATSPYSGPDAPPAGIADTWLDVKLKTAVGPNQTLRLGPGIFYTRGIDVNGTGWAVQSGMRIVGSGIGVTTLKLYNEDPIADRCALGMKAVPTVPLAGFEASDMTLDLNYPTTPGTANRAAFLYGSHIYLKRLRIINFGGTTNGEIIVLQAASVQSEDCVVDEVAIERTAAIGNASCVLVGFTGNDGSPHSYCVVRNCFLRGTSNSAELVHGILPGCALGFTAEGNELIDLTSGIYDPAYPWGTETGYDITVRHNYIRNVQNGISYLGRAYPMKRMIIHDNVIDVRTGGTGIALLGSVNPIVYTALIIRKNVIRGVTWDQPTPGSYAYGIHVSRTQDLVAQYNIINNATTGVGTSLVTNSTINNNINTQGLPV